MCRDDRPVAPTDVGDGDQPDCADRKRRLEAPALVGNDWERRLQSATNAP